MFGDDLLDPYGLRTGSTMDPYNYYGQYGDLTNYGGAADYSPRGASTSRGLGIQDALGGVLGYADRAVTPAARTAQASILKTARGIGKPAGQFSNKANFLRMAGSPRALAALKIGTGLAAAGGVMGVGDVILGKDSAANKVMDSVAMGIGGTLGAVGGPMGIAAGAGIGKTASDSLQWLFGDKKTAEQRKLESALTQLNGGRI